MTYGPWFVLIDDTNVLNNICKNRLNNYLATSVALVSLITLTLI